MRSGSFPRIHSHPVVPRGIRKILEMDDQIISISFDCLDLPLVLTLGDHRSQLLSVLMIEELS
uniref:Uncharacterized protein n=2 Tax=Lepeophtheirus salmonis TaxID=72036 RepID=A0A0K2VBD7_LEPSM